MKRLLVFLLFFVMILTTQVLELTLQTLERQLTHKRIRVGVIPLYQVGIRKNQQRHIKVVHHLIQQLQILLTHIQAIKE